MTYNELNALIQQQLAQDPSFFTGIWADDTATGTQQVVRPGQMYDLGNGTYAAPMPDGRIRVQDYSSGDGVNSGYDLYPDGQQVPWGNDKSASTWEQFRSVAVPVGAMALGGYGLEAAGLLGGAGSGAADAAALASADAGMAGFSGAGAGAGTAAGVAGAGGVAGAAGPLATDAAALSAASNGAWDVLPAAGAATAPAGLPRLPDGGIDYAKLLSNPALLAAGAGALAGIAGNGDITSSQSGNTNGTSSASTNSTGSQSLAPWLQGHAQDYLANAQQLANAPSSNATMDASRGLLAGYAQQGDPLVNAARAQQQNLIGGGMLNANPYIDQVAQNIGSRMGDAYATGTRAGTFSRFNNDGNSVYGKSAAGQTTFQNDRAFGDSLGQTMNNLYYGNYANERAAQDAAARSSLQFGQFGVNNAQNLYNVGAQDWQRPYFQNAQYGAAINPAFGSQTSGATNALGATNQNTNSSSTVQAPNNALAGAGGALSALSIYNMLYPQRRA